MMSAADVNSCIILNEQDNDFGEIVTFEGRSQNQTKQELPSQLINRETLADLSVKQQNELLELLDNYADCFSDLPGLTNRAKHSIQLMPGFKPKHLRE